MSITNINALNAYAAPQPVHPVPNTPQLEQQNKEASETRLNEKAAQAARDAFTLTLSREAQARMEEEGCKALDEAHAQRQEAQLRATENREREEAVLASAPIDTPQKARNAGGIVNIIA